MGEKSLWGIHPTALIDIDLRPLQNGVPAYSDSEIHPAEIAQDSYIGPFCVIGHTVSIGSHVIIDAYTKIDPEVSIGDRTLLVYRATIGGQVVIGEDCVVGGSVSEGSNIGDRCRSFGKLIHSHTNSTMSWDHHSEPEPGPTLLDDSFVAHDAVVVGQVRIGPQSYVCSGAIVTKDVPPFHIAFGVNSIVHHSEWPGPLSENPLFSIDK